MFTQRKGLSKDSNPGLPGAPRPPCLWTLKQLFFQTHHSGLCTCLQLLDSQQLN